jgi:cobalt/nickel transport system permease protein
MAQLSSHVPDPRLLTTYAERRNGPLHRVNAWTKVAALPILVAAVTVARGLPTVLAVYAIALGVYAVARLPVRRLAGWYTLPVVFVTTVGGPVAFGVSGDPIASLSTPLGPLTLTSAGVETYLTLLGRGLAVVTYSIALWATTGYTDLAYVLGRTLPAPIDQIALLAYRFTFVTLETLEDLVAATRSRGASLLSEFWPNHRRYGQILGLTFLTAIERSERLVKAMEARGYDGDLTVHGHVAHPPIRDLVALGGLVSVVAAYAAVVTYGVVG